MNIQWLYTINCMCMHIINNVIVFASLTSLLSFSFLSLFNFSFWYFCLKRDCAGYYELVYIYNFKNLVFLYIFIFMLNSSMMNNLFLLRIHWKEHIASILVTWLQTILFHWYFLCVYCSLDIGKVNIH